MRKKLIFAVLFLGLLTIFLFVTERRKMIRLPNDTQRKCVTKFSHCSCSYYADFKNDIPVADCAAMCIGTGESPIAKLEDGKCVLEDRISSCGLEQVGKTTTRTGEMANATFNLTDNFSKDLSIGEALNSRGVICKDMKLLSRSKEVLLYQRTGCWGNPPFNYQDIAKKEQENIKSLADKYHVVEVSCNPSGLLIQ